jgi:hypothetical protein
MQSFVKIPDALLRVAVEYVCNLSLYRTFLYLVNNLLQLRGLKFCNGLPKSCQKIGRNPSAKPMALRLSVLVADLYRVGIKRA